MRGIDATTKGFTMKPIKLTTLIILSTVLLASCGKDSNTNSPQQYDGCSTSEQSARKVWVNTETGHVLDMTGCLSGSEGCGTDSFHLKYYTNGTLSYDWTVLGSDPESDYNARWSVCGGVLTITNKSNGDNDETYR